VSRGIRLGVEQSTTSGLGFKATVESNPLSHDIAGYIVQVTGRGSARVIVNILP